MNETERQALAVAFEARRAELRKLADWYRENPVGRTWTDRAAENDARLDELDRLALAAQVEEMTEGEKVVAWGK